MAALERDAEQRLNGLFAAACLEFDYCRCRDRAEANLIRGDGNCGRSGTSLELPRELGAAVVNQLAGERQLLRGHRAADRALRKLKADGEHAALEPRRELAADSQLGCRDRARVGAL